MMIHMIYGNMANILAEDAGAPELRNPLSSGMQSRGRISRFFSRKNRKH